MIPRRPFHSLSLDLIDKSNKPSYEHSEQARAPHTNGPRDVPRCGALSSSSKDATLQGRGVLIHFRKDNKKEKEV